MATFANKEVSSYSPPPGLALSFSSMDVQERKRTDRRRQNEVGAALSIAAGGSRARENEILLAMLAKRGMYMGDTMRILRREGKKIPAIYERASAESTNAMLVDAGVGVKALNLLERHNQSQIGQRIWSPAKTLDKFRNDVAQAVPHEAICRF